MAADTLSRVQGTNILCMAISVVSSDLESLIKSSYQLDPQITTILHALQQI